MLAAFVESRDELRGRIKSFCFDLHRRFFRPEAFDVVIGAAILHHLLDPRAALINVSGSVKPGEKIILVEPLEAGSLLLTSINVCGRVARPRGSGVRRRGPGAIDEGAAA
jgi:SAM-dependent methyltransferase